jgi:hypothetical protein
VTPGIPVVINDLPPGMKQRMWSPISALLVDAFITVEQADALVDWVAASDKNLTTIYATHEHSSGASPGSTRQRLHRETFGAPTRQAALERADLRDSPSQQGERHPGAGRFVGSRTEENDFDVARNLQVALLQVLGGYPEGTGNRIGVGALFQGGTQIHDHRLLPGVDPSLKLYGTDAGDAELAEEAAAPRGLDHKVRNQNGDQKRKGALAKP